MASQALFQTMVLFILIIVGIVGFKTGIFNREYSKGMSTMLLQIVTPAVVLNSFMTEYSPEKAKNLIFAGLICILAYIITINGSRLIFRPRDDYDAPITRFNTIYPNNGYMGMPLAQGIFGDIGTFYMSVQVAVFNIFCFTQGVNLLKKGEKKEGIDWKNMITPPVLSIAVGLVIYFFRIPVPDIIRRPIGMIGQLQSPIAMFIAGGSIYQTDIRHLKNIPVILKAVFVRLLLFPLIYIFIISRLPLDSTMRLVAALGASCPAAAYGIIFAVRYERDEEITAAIFSVSTIISAITIPLMLTWAGYLGIG